MRTIASYVSPQALARRTRAALVGLGYQVVAASTRGRFDDDGWRPDLRIVDDRHLDKLPAGCAGAEVPVIVLRGERSRCWRDPRVVGEIERPARLEEIYPLLQSALEPHPRRAARAPTQLPARCARADQRWMGDIVSLSTRGCLFRAPSGPAPDGDFNLFFPLPRGRMVHTRARIRFREGEHLGIEFRNPPPAACDAVGDYVSERLATARA